MRRQQITENKGEQRVTREKRSNSGERRAEGGEGKATEDSEGMRERKGGGTSH